MSAKPIRPVNRPNNGRLRWFVTLVGAFFGLALLKFGTAVIMEKQITWPKDGYEWAIAQWPVALGYGLLLGLGLLGARVARWHWGNQRWLAALPLAWFVWQLLSATATVDATLTGPTLAHFAACVACFYLGFFALSRAASLGGFWLPIIVALLLVELVGADQRFRGLAETRDFLLKNEATHWRDCPPEQVAEMERNRLLLPTPEGHTVAPGLLQKAESLRISSTLFYPNALAGALLLLLPASGAAILRTARLTPGAKALVLGLAGGGGLACLYWSGSKAGWLLALVLAAMALLHSPLSRQIKTGIVACLLIFGIVGFGVRYASFFQKGATSVAARFDYWQAAWKTALTHPLIGTGPGTFMRPYERIKRPESEMARLTHNDYLQQASDSGWPGFALYAALVAGVLAVSGRWAFKGQDWEAFAVWLGALGWALQSLVEFGLYIPALAWPAFALIGWLLARSTQNDSTISSSASSLVPH